MTKEHKGLNPNHKKRKPYDKQVTEHTHELRRNRPTKTKKKTMKVLCL